MGQILGRHKQPCVSCEFDGVHVKQNPGKLPYLHCPDCGLMSPAKNGQQAAGLVRNMRPQKIDQAASQAPKPPAAERPIEVPPEVAALAVPEAPPPAQQTPAAPARRAGLWDSLMNSGGKS